MSIISFRKSITIILAIAMSTLMLINFSYANTYSNNSIEIEVSPQRRSYDYGDNVGIDISITKKTSPIVFSFLLKAILLPSFAKCPK